jgi:hypothetical protein
MVPAVALTVLTTIPWPNTLGLRSIMNSITTVYHVCVCITVGSLLTTLPALRVHPLRSTAGVQCSRRWCKRVQRPGVAQRGRLRQRMQNRHGRKRGERASLRPGERPPALNCGCCASHRSPDIPT